MVSTRSVNRWTALAALGVLALLAQPAAVGPASGSTARSASDGGAPSECSLDVVGDRPVALDADEAELGELAVCVTVDADLVEVDGLEATSAGEELAGLKAS